MSRIRDIFIWRYKMRIINVYINYDSMNHATLSGPFKSIVINENNKFIYLYVPELVHNKTNKNEFIRGSIIVKRITENDKKEVVYLNINYLKKDEWVKMDFKSSTLLKFNRFINLANKMFSGDANSSRFEDKFLIYDDNVKLTPDQLLEITNFIEKNSDTFLYQSEKSMKELLTNQSLEFTQKILNLINEMDLNDINIDSIVNSAKISKAINEFETGIKEDKKEREFWQNYFETNKWIFGHENSIVIGKTKLDIDNELDFVVENFEGYVDIIEIKNPFKNEFWVKDGSHNNLITINEVNKAIFQVMNYICDLEKRMNEADLIERLGIKILKPRATIIIGRSNNWDEEKKRALKLLNDSLVNITILTYDMVLTKMKNIQNIIMGNSA